MHSALDYTVAHTALLRSNKRDASLIISKRLTRIGKLAVSLGEKPSDDEGDEVADAAEVVGGPVMRHGHALVMSVAQVEADVVPKKKHWGNKKFFFIFILKFSKENSAFGFGQ